MDLTQVSKVKSNRRFAFLAISATVIFFLVIMYIISTMKSSNDTVDEDPSTISNVKLTAKKI